LKEERKEVTQNPKNPKTVNVTIALTEAQYKFLTNLIEFYEPTKSENSVKTVEQWCQGHVESDIEFVIDELASGMGQLGFSEQLPFKNAYSLEPDC